MCNHLCDIFLIRHDIGAADVNRIHTPLSADLRSIEYLTDRVGVDSGGHQHYPQLRTHKFLTFKR